jgi:hypothetical protein
MFRQQGGRTLREEGVLAAVEGMSSLDEVLRVTHNEDCEDDQNARSAAKATNDEPPAAPQPAVAAPAPQPEPPKDPSTRTPPTKTPPAPKPSAPPRKPKKEAA